MASWIFLRGLTRETAHWGSFPQRFAQLLPGVKIITLDLPGNGTQNQHVSPLSIAELVSFCRAEMARLNVAPPYYLLAMSMGAMVGAQWAQTAPQELRGAVLINTSFSPFNPFYQRLRPGNWGTLLRLALLAPAPQTIELAVLRMTSQDPGAHAADLASWLRARSRRPVRTANAVRQLIAAARFRAARHAPATPVLLLGSLRDQLVNVRCTQTIAHQWNCAVALHDHAGHDLPLDDPQWVAEQVQAWLAKEA